MSNKNKINNNSEMWTFFWWTCKYSTKVLVFPYQSKSLFAADAAVRSDKIVS